jgi:hypothetical protein
VRKVEGLQHLDVVEDLPQEVRAGRFYFGRQKAVEKLRKDRPSSLSKNGIDKL